MKTLPAFSCFVMLLGAMANARAMAAHRVVDFAGTIEAVDVTASSGTLTIGGGTTVLFTVDTTTKIRLGDSPVSLADLLPGTDAEIRIVSATGVAEWIHAPKYVEESGTILVLDPTSDTMILVLPDETTYACGIDAATRITIGDARATFTTLQAGMDIKVRMLQATGMAEEVHGPGILEKRGTIATVDTTANQVTLTLPDGSTLQFNVDSKTRITIRGKKNPLANLQAGTTATVRVRQATWVAEQIDVH